MMLTERVYGRYATAADIKPGVLFAPRCSDGTYEERLTTVDQVFRKDGKVYLRKTGWQRTLAPETPVIIALRDRTGGLIRWDDVPAEQWNGGFYRDPVIPAELVTQYEVGVLDNVQLLGFTYESQVAMAEWLQANVIGKVLKDRGRGYLFEVHNFKITTPSRAASAQVWVDGRVIENYTPDARTTTYDAYAGMRIL